MEWSSSRSPDNTTSKTLTAEPEGADPEEKTLAGGAVRSITFDKKEKKKESFELLL